MTELLKQHRIAVSSENDMVVLALGNVEVKMSYETALELSTWLRIRGKEAKKFAGDTKRHWSVIAQFHDSNGNI